MEWFSDNETLIQAALAGALLAYSFQIAMRAGVFTLAGVGFWAIGGYTTAYLVTEREWATAPAIVVGDPHLGRHRPRCWRSSSDACARSISRWRPWPSCCSSRSSPINWEDVTGGAGGMFGIPVTVSTWQLLRDRRGRLGRRSSSSSAARRGRTIEAHAPRRAGGA